MRFASITFLSPYDCILLFRLANQPECTSFPLCVNKARVIVGNWFRGCAILRNLSGGQQ